MPLHIDGARFFNACVALGVAPAELAAPADTVTFCLSKGLSAPIGSVVVGPAPFIDRARRARKLVGGGMRQVGVLAAAGLVALQDGDAGMIDRLAEDHANARRLAVGLAELTGVRSPGGMAQPEDGPLDPGRFLTNFVLFRVDRDRAAFLAALEARGVLVVPYAHGQIRAVTHFGVTAADVDRVVATAAEVLRELPPPRPRPAEPPRARPDRDRRPPAPPDQPAPPAPPRAPAPPRGRRRNDDPRPSRARTSRDRPRPPTLARSTRASTTWSRPASGA